MKFKYIIGGMFILLGLSAFTGIDLGRFIGPAFLILIGWAILTGGRRKYEMDKSESGQEMLNEVLVFSGSERKLISQSFKGGKVAAVFAGMNLDLTKVKTKNKDIILELVAVFGSIQLTVPKNWKVTTSEAVGVLGGIDNKTHAQQSSVELKIKGAAIFGGIEIRN